MAEKKAYSIANKYEVQGDKLVRKNKWSPKKGEGYFMAEHKDRRTCGATSYMEKKE
jgi:small subunit ribosomal protein S27Ae